MPPRRRDPADYLPLASDAVCILLALAAGPRHGYGIIRDVEEGSGGHIVLQTGALYRMLRRFLDDGFIEERPRPADEPSGDERRRYYALTPFGHSVLDAEVTRMAGLVRAARLTAAGKRPKLV
jgi:DNA-binding PadR family transcriptional regulator